jgi:NTE family protein
VIIQKGRIPSLAFLYRLPMKKKLAFVLGSGGSRGAMQVGAIQALFEAGYQPDLVTGSSIGAANGAYLAVHGYNRQGIEKLKHVWETTVSQDLLPTNLWWQVMQAFFRRTRGFSQQRIREFAIANGLTPDLRFKDLQKVKLYPVAADLDADCPVIFGLDPEESVLESVLTSMALPPWIAPVEKNGHYLVDGGAVSNLPIEAALLQGATEIIALDLFDTADGKGGGRGLGNFLLKLDKTVENRHKRLEIELAKARGVPVRRISLTGVNPIPLWDFRQSEALIERGYQLARRAIDRWPAADQSPCWSKKNVESLLEEVLEVLE